MPVAVGQAVAELVALGGDLDETPLRQIGGAGPVGPFA